MHLRVFSTLLFLMILHETYQNKPKKPPAPKPKPKTPKPQAPKPPPTASIQNKEIRCGTRIGEGNRYNTVENSRLSLHILGKDTESNADPASPWPWMMFIMVRAPEKEIPVDVCGGTLVQVCEDSYESDIVLTAAHCLAYLDNNTGKTLPRKLEDLLVYGDVYERKNRSLSRKARVKHLSYPPSYDADIVGSANDIGFLLLDRPMSNRLRMTEEQKKISPICLPTGPHGKTQKPWEMSTCYVAGWGVPLHNWDPNIKSANVSNYLRQTQYQVLPPHKCIKTLLDEGYANDDPYEDAIDRFKVGEDLWPRQLCAIPFGNKDKFHSKGDSGGPIMCRDHPSHKWILTGVISGLFPTLKSKKKQPLLATAMSVQRYMPRIGEFIRTKSSVCKKCTKGKRRSCRYFESSPSNFEDFLLDFFSALTISQERKIENCSHRCLHY